MWEYPSKHHTLLLIDLEIIQIKKPVMSSLGM